MVDRAAERPTARERLERALERELETLPSQETLLLYEQALRRD